jgi:hypothetical protein
METLYEEGVVMNVNVDMKFYCKACRSPVEVGKEYNPACESMPPLITNHFNVTPCEGCIIKRITKALKIMRREDRTHDYEPIRD